MEYKECSLCKETKFLDDFYFRSDQQTYRNDCKECNKSRNKKYYQYNKESKIKYQKEYSKNNLDSARIYKKTYKIRHKDKIREYERERYRLIKESSSV